MIKCRNCQSDKTRSIGPDYSDFKIYRCWECSHDSIIWNEITYTLDSFSPEFWRIPGKECVKCPDKLPVSIEQALWEMSTKDWDKMLRTLFANSYQSLLAINVGQIMDIIKKTNTCTSLDFPVEVWINKDYRIKVYNDQ